MENEAIADEILSALQALLEAAGPEWTLEALGALMQEVGGAEQMPSDMPPEVMSQGGPGAMPAMQGGPPMAPKRGMMGKRIN